MFNIFIFGHSRPFPVCVVAVAVLFNNMSTSTSVSNLVEGVGIDIHSFFTTSSRLVTRANPFAAMRRCVGQSLAPWAGWTWRYTVLLLYNPWHPILTVGSLETFLFWSRYETVWDWYVRMAQGTEYR